MSQLLRSTYRSCLKALHKSIQNHEGDIGRCLRSAFGPLLALHTLQLATPLKTGAKSTSSAENEKVLQQLIRKFFLIDDPCRTDDTTGLSKAFELIRRLLESSTNTKSCTSLATMGSTISINYEDQLATVSGRILLPQEGVTGSSHELRLLCVPCDPFHLANIVGSFKMPLIRELLLLEAMSAQNIVSEKFIANVPKNHGFPPPSAFRCESQFCAYFPTMQAAEENHVAQIDLKALDQESHVPNLFSDIKTFRSENKSIAFRLINPDLFNVVKAGKVKIAHQARRHCGDLSSFERKDTQELLLTLPTSTTTITNDTVAVTISTTYMGVAHQPRDDRSDGEPWPRHLFQYRVSVSNVSTDISFAIVSRHWTFVDVGRGDVKEVVGPGLVGHQPLLHPSQSFTYDSGTYLFSGASAGYMVGRLQCAVFSPDNLSTNMTLDAEVRATALRHTE